MNTKFIFSATVAFFFCTGANSEINLAKFDRMVDVVMDQFQEQVRSLRSVTDVFSRPLGDSPIEVGLKVVMNAFEIFTIASGTHFFRSKAERKREMQLIAITSSNLCQNLTTMVDMYEAIFNATLYTADELLLKPAYADKALERLFEILEQFVNSSSTLKDIYAKERADVAQKKPPPVGEGVIDFWYIQPDEVSFAMSSAYKLFPRIRYFAVNMLFTFWTCDKLTNSYLKERHALAKDLMTVFSKSEKPNEVNKLFVRAMEEAAEALDPLKISMYDVLFKMSDILFQKLRNAFGDNDYIV